VIDQHDQHGAAFECGIDVDLLRAGAFELARQLRGMGFDHGNAAAEPAGECCGDEPRRAFAEVVDIGLEGEAEAGHL